MFDIKKNRRIVIEMETEEKKKKWNRSVNK